MVTCTSSSLDIIPITLNPHITTLSMHNSQVKTIDDGFQFYEALVTLNLSNNQIQTIQDGAFISQMQLVSLTLDHNRLSLLTAGTLSGLKSLYSLSVSHNLLEFLTTGWITSCPNLTKLNLDNNRLSTISADAFNGARKLVYLNLANNMLKDVPELADLPHLEFLSFQNNGLDVLSLCDFLGMPRLHTLNIRNTSLNNLLSCDAELRSVRWLDISDNWLTLPLPQLLALPNLESVSIGQTNLTKLSKQSFIGLDKLRSIQISHVQGLVSIEPGIFAGLQNLENITITSNPLLTFLPVGMVISGQRALSVSASDNGLTWLDPGCLPWDRLVYLDLSNNPLHCDCRLAWLAKTIASSYHTAVCASPQELSGKNLTALKPDQLRCVFLGPLQVSVVSVCLVVISLALGCVTFLIYRSRRPRPAIADFPPPAYHINNYKCDDWQNKEHENDSSRWTFLEPDCGCQSVFHGNDKQQMDKNEGNWPFNGHSKSMMDWPRVYTIMGGQDNSSSQETIINRQNGSNGVSVESLAGDDSLTDLIRLSKNKKLLGNVRTTDSKESLSFLSFQQAAGTSTRKKLLNDPKIAGVKTMETQANKKVPRHCECSSNLKSSFDKSFNSWTSADDPDPVRNKSESYATTISSCQNKFPEPRSGFEDLDIVKGCGAGVAQTLRTDLHRQHSFDDNNLNNHDRFNAERINNHDQVTRTFANQFRLSKL